jgi:hypothetical protein
MADFSDYLPLEETEAEQETLKMDLARKIQEGIDSLNRGEGIPGEVVEATLNAKIAALRLEQ